MATTVEEYKKLKEEYVKKRTIEIELPTGLVLHARKVSPAYLSAILTRSGVKLGLSPKEYKELQDKLASGEDVDGVAYLDVGVQLVTRIDDVFRNLYNVVVIDKPDIPPDEFDIDDKLEFVNIYMSTLELEAEGGSSDVVSFRSDDGKLSDRHDGESDKQVTV